MSNLSAMQTPSHPSATGTRSRSPSSTRSPPARPLKRRRRSWAMIVEDMVLADGVETDEHRIAQRQKQIDFGKNTLAYDRFSAVLPRHKRRRGDPMTPLAKQKCSRRSFSGQLTSWKKKVYAFVAALQEVREEENEKVERGEREKRNVVCQGDGGSDQVDGAAVDAEEAGQKVLVDAAGAGKAEQGSVNGVILDSAAGQEDEEEFSDMDDIQLDDFGNVIPSESTPPPNEDSNEQVIDKAKVEDSPPSIFDVY